MVPLTSEIQAFRVTVSIEIYKLIHCIDPDTRSRDFNCLCFVESIVEYNESSMTSISSAVLKATLGLLVDKGRDKAAAKLKEGDVTDKKFRNLIVREIDDIKTKLDGLARKDILASISLRKGSLFYTKCLKRQNAMRNSQ